MICSHTMQDLAALWAAECVKRVLHIYEDSVPGDCRPRAYVEAMEGYIALRRPSYEAVEAAREAAREAWARLPDVGCEDGGTRAAAFAACSIWRPSIAAFWAARAAATHFAISRGAALGILPDPHYSFEFAAEQAWQASRLREIKTNAW